MGSEMCIRDSLWDPGLVQRVERGYHRARMSTKEQTVPRDVRGGSERRGLTARRPSCCAQLDVRKTAQTLRCEARPKQATSKHVRWCHFSSVEPFGRILDPQTTRSWRRKNRPSSRGAQPPPRCAERPRALRRWSARRTTTTGLRLTHGHSWRPKSRASRGRSIFAPPAARRL